MQLEHHFTLPVGIDEAWRMLRDTELVGPCVPGAAIDGPGGEGVLGSMRVKLGPLNLTYGGTAGCVDQDADARRFVVRADGVDARGNGTATAVVTATLTAEHEQTRVQVETELDFTGKPETFSRAVMVEVVDRLLGQFAANLAAASRGEAPPAGKKAAKRPAKKVSAPLPDDVTAAPPAGAEPAATDAVGAEPALSEATRATTPGTPAFANPGAMPAPIPDEEPSMNGHSTPTPAATSARTRADLVKAARPYVAKGLGPAAVSLVIVLAVARRRRSPKP